MIAKLGASVILAITAMLIREAAAQGFPSMPRSRSLRESSTFECTIMAVALLEIQPGTIDDIMFECEMDPADMNGKKGMTRRMKVTGKQKKVLSEMLKNGQLVSGQSKLTHEGKAKFDGKDLFVPQDIDISSSIQKGKGRFDGSGNGGGSGNGNDGGNGNGNGNGNSKGKLNGIRADWTPKRKRRPQMETSGRRLAVEDVTGDKPILAVKVFDKNGLAHPDSPSEISDNIFGTSTDQVNLKSQLYDCSMEKLNVVPGDNGELVNPNFYTAEGVMDVSIDVDITVTDGSTIRNAIVEAVETKIGFNLPGPYEQVMFILEGCYGDGCGWAAYAYINSWNSVYNGGYYALTGVQVHELGHNFGLAHSGGVDGYAYSDHTCMMGNPLYSDEVGRMCYNPAKNFQIGWYSDRVMTLNPFGEGSSWSKDITIVGIADYLDQTTVNDPVVIKLETETSDDFFIGFNRATGVNADNDEASDLVTIVQTGGNGETYSQSFLKAYIDESESYTIEEIGGTPKDVVIEVLEITKPSNAPWRATIRLQTIQSPTFAPTPYDCDQEVLRVAVTTDGYPLEISWSLFNKCTNEVEVTSPSYTATNSDYSNKFCISKAEYTFIISDSYNDGICCGYGSGSYSVSYNSNVVASGGEFAGSEATTFGSCDGQSPRPTVSPTPPPTTPPTRAMTQPPTSVPTLSPIKSPTPPPSPSPIKSPTTFPTSSPTISPISSPTSSPTLLDACAGKVLTTINVTTDWYPAETNWTLFNTCTNEIEILSPEYPEPETHYSNTYCVPHAKFVLTVNDSFGDGICCGYGLGNWDLSYQSIVISSGGEFKRSETVSFGSCETE